MPSTPPRVVGDSALPSTPKMSPFSKADACCLFLLPRARGLSERLSRSIFVDDHDVYQASLDVGQQPAQGGTVEVAAGEAAVVVAVVDKRPTLGTLGGDVGLAGGALGVVVTQLREVIGSGRVSVQAIIHYATRQTMSSIGSRPDFTHSGFREALLQVAGDGGVINSRRLSKWIGISENRIVEGFRITRLTMFRGFLTWRLDRTAEERADAA